MGAYAMPSKRPFRASGKIKTKRKRTMLDRNAALLRGSKVKLIIRDGVAVLEKVDE